MPKRKSKKLFRSREIEILDLLNKDNSCKMVAALLFISVQTVYKHISNACKRNGVHEQTALYRIAIEEGYLRVTVFK